MENNKIRRNNKIRTYQATIDGKVIKFKERHYRKQKNYWNVFKFTDNIAWMAVCDCNNSYYCSTSDFKENEIGEPIWVTEIKFLYRFCPCCGKEYNLKVYNDYTDIDLPGLIATSYKSLQEIKKTYRNLEEQRENNYNDN